MKIKIQKNIFLYLNKMNCLDCGCHMRKFTSKQDWNNRKYCLRCYRENHAFNNQLAREKRIQRVLKTIEFKLY